MGEWISVQSSRELYAHQLEVARPGLDGVYAAGDGTAFPDQAGGLAA